MFEWMECTSGHVVHLRITLHVIIWGGDCIPGYTGCIPHSKCLLLFLRKQTHGISTYAPKNRPQQLRCLFSTKGLKTKPMCKQPNRPRNTRPLHSQVWQLLLTKPIAVKGNSWVNQWWHWSVVEKNGVIPRFFTFFGVWLLWLPEFSCNQKCALCTQFASQDELFPEEKMKKSHQTNDFWIFGVLFLSLDRVTLLWHATWDSSKSSLDTR